MAATAHAPLRVLYVEDNEELRELLGMYLEDPGRTVTVCGSAEEALLLDAAAPFDVVVSDIGLPGMSGTELARRLLAPAPDRWVVLCSGYRYGEAVMSLGCNVRELPKPFDGDDLDRLFAEIDGAAQGAAADRLPPPLPVEPAVRAQQPAARH